MRARALPFLLLLAPGCVIVRDVRSTGETSGLRTIEGPSGPTSYSIQSGGQLVVETTTETRVPRMGIGVRDRRPDPAASAPASPRGVVVESIEAGGPASRAGLAVGDRLTNLDGEDIGSREQFVKKLRSLDPAKPVPVLGLRKGEPFGVNVTLEPRTESVRETKRRTLDHEREGRAFGLEASTVPPDLAVRLFGKDGPAVLLSDVVVGGPAHRAGLRQGDPVLRVGGREVASAREAIDPLAEARSGERVEFLVGMGSDRREIEVAADPGFSRSTRVHVPLVVDWETGCERREFELVEGLLFEWSHRDLPTRARERRTRWRVAFVLDLLEVSSSDEETRVRLLWFISFASSRD